MAYDLDIGMEQDSYPEEVAERTQEASYDHQEVYNLARTNLDFLGAMAFPDIMECSFPPTYVAIWQWLVNTAHKERDFSKMALGLPRGFCKTTLIKLFILYLVLFTSRKFVLVLAATATLAENIISDVADMLDEPNIKAVFGDWRVGLEKDTQAVKKFGFRSRNVILAALGQGGSVRGLNIKNARPDVMVFDDIQTREDADSELVSRGIEQWMVGTAMKAKDPRGCMYIFIANMYPTKWSILRRLKENSEWIKFIAGAILADGTSLWEELHPIEQLKEEFRTDYASGHPEIFYSEVLNDENANLNFNIALDNIPSQDYTYEVSAGSFIVIDPSNDKANSDDVSIGAFDIIDGKPVIVEVIADKLSPGRTIERALELAMRRGISLIVVEANAFQYSLCYWFEQVCKQLGIYGIEAVPIYSGKLSKNSRILTMFKQLTAGELGIHPNCYSQVTSQITQFNQLKTNNVDGILDLLTYAPRVLTEFGEFITINSPLVADNSLYKEAQVWEVEDNCAF